MSFRSTQGFQITDLLISLKFHKIYICLFIPWIIISKLRDIIWWVVMATSVLELSRHQINSNSLMMSTKSPPPLSSLACFLSHFLHLLSFAVFLSYSSIYLSLSLSVYSFFHSFFHHLSLSLSHGWHIQFSLLHSLYILLSHFPCSFPVSLSPPFSFPFIYLLQFFHPLFPPFSHQFIYCLLLPFQYVWHEPPSATVPTAETWLFWLKLMRFNTKPGLLLYSLRSP